MCEFRVLRQTVQCSVTLIPPPNKLRFCNDRGRLIKAKGSLKF